MKYIVCTADAKQEAKISVLYTAICVCVYSKWKDKPYGTNGSKPTLILNCS